MQTVHETIVDLLSNSYWQGKFQLDLWPLLRRPD